MKLFMLFIAVWVKHQMKLYWNWLERNKEL